MADSDIPAIIPAPAEMIRQPGGLTLPAKISVAADEALPEIQPILAFLRDYLCLESAGSAPALLTLTLNQESNVRLGDEGYRLDINTNGITLRANRPAGLFYGVQTLLQLLPPAVERKDPAAARGWALPCLEITDYPRFGWRGMMLDVVRHFFDVAQVKQFIDQMARYKYNLLHLHLTDDQGWRLEIKSLPRLTEVGAWRPERTGTFGTFPPPALDEPCTYGGFFTHDDIRALVRHARSRFVDILPEIDVPGHSLAAIAAYPALSCAPEAGNYRVNAGEKLIDWRGHGDFNVLRDNTLCPAHPQVYDFLDKVMTEVAGLFPFPYIHMGGDECDRSYWRQSPAVQELMRRESLNSLEAVQSHFVRRVEQIISSKGKKLIGWDEILDGGLAPGAAVMSWRGTAGGIKAAHLGHEVVMCPSTHAYLDLMQGDAVAEPLVYSTVRLKTAYAFEPVPDGVDARFIRGGQANLWTEQVCNMRQAQYMTWPRGFAVAEALWSPRSKKDWDNFVQRTETHFERFEAAQVKYARSLFDPIFETTTDARGGLQVILSTEVDGLDIHYSFDNSEPDNFYPHYTAPLTIPTGATLLRVVTCRQGRLLGRQISMPVEELRAREARKRR